jgi:hypothetical protein
VPITPTSNATTNRSMLRGRTASGQDGSRSRIKIAESGPLELLRRVASYPSALACRGPPRRPPSLQAEAAHALRDLRLDALPLPIELPALLALQAPSRGRQGLVLGARMQAEPAAPGPGTPWLGGHTRQTAG